MPKTAPFDAHPDRYDEWFERHDAAYQSELRALRALLPDGGQGLEVGVGTGRFAAPLGIGYGVDPSAEMLARARERGIEVKDGTGEALPYPDERFDRVLMTTTLCFLTDPLQAFEEVRRVLRPGGVFVLGMIDADSPLGRRYQQKQEESPFYRGAHFHEATEVIRLLKGTGFENIQVCHTLFSEPETMREPDPVREGIGEGSFVVIRGETAEGQPEKPGGLH